MSEEKHWGVDVRFKHEHILTIEADYLVGKESFTDEENDAIYKCGEHLISFARNPKDMPETRTDFAVFDTLDRLMREGYTIRIGAVSQTFYIANKKGGQVISGRSFRDLCFNIVLAGL